MPVPLMSVSQMPMMNAPITAPGMEPMPPNTAATKAFRPGMAPDGGGDGRIVGEVQHGAHRRQERADDKGHGDDVVDLDAHELRRLKVLGNGTHGHADLGVVDQLRSAARTSTSTRTGVMMTVTSFVEVPTIVDGFVQNADACGYVMGWPPVT